MKTARPQKRRRHFPPSHRLWVCSPWPHVSPTCAVTSLPAGVRIVHGRLSRASPRWRSRLRRCPVSADHVAYPMADKLSAEARSKLMARVRQTGTEPERIVRTILRNLRLRYASHVRRRPGRPDLVLRDVRVVIFVHGCFWHSHSGCRRGTPPQTNRDFWLRKIGSNVRRDRAAVRALRAAGWCVAVVWQCQTGDTKRLAARLRRLVSRASR